MRPVLALALLAGCDGSTYGYAGHNTDEYFALDGDRYWKYAQEDSSVAWKLKVEKRPDTQKVGNTEIVTLEYKVDDPAELLYSISWSSDSSDGIQIHKYAVEGGTEQTFDPPLAVSTARMTPGEDVETVTGGMTYLSTLVAVESCPNHWVTDEWECLHFTISDGSDGSASAPFVGDWWMAADWGASRMNVGDLAQDWVLTEAHWSADEE